MERMCDCEKSGAITRPNWSRRSRRSSVCQKALGVLGVMTISFLVVYSLSFVWRVAQTISTLSSTTGPGEIQVHVKTDKWGWPNPCWCGETYSEAMALGCKYDHLAVDYLPQHCIDDEVVDKFIHAGPGLDGMWDYYYNLEDAYYGRNAFYDLDIVEDLARNGSKYYASPEWHAGHCLYLWYKIERGVSEMEWFDATHGEHCMGFVMESWRQMVNREMVLPTCIAGTLRHQRDPVTGRMVRPPPKLDQCVEQWKPGLPRNSKKGY